ncbi:MAG: LmeA family phospholipid-binding protein [Sporichthyaceae bacterium]
MSELSSTSEAKPRRRRLRRRLGIGAGAALVLLLIGDRGGQVLAERVVADRIQDCLRTPDRPTVAISGFPFLDDLVRREIARMSLTARDVDASGIRVQEIRAEVRGAGQRDGQGFADSLAGSGLVAYEAMSAVAPGVGVSYGGDGQIKVGAGFGLLSASAVARASIVDGALVIEPGQVSTPLLGGLDLGALGPITIPLRQIPEGLRVTLNPTERGLEFAFDGTDITLPQGECT